MLAAEPRGAGADANDVIGVIDLCKIQGISTTVFTRLQPDASERFRQQIKLINVFISVFSLNILNLMNRTESGDHPAIDSNVEFPRGTFKNCRYRKMVRGAGILHKFEVL